MNKHDRAAVREVPGANIVENPFVLGGNHPKSSISKIDWILRFSKACELLSAPKSH